MSLLYTTQFADFYNYNNKTICKIKHIAGMFSNCSVILLSLFDYYYKTNTLPDNIDTTITFQWYNLPNVKTDIRHEYFKITDDNNLNTFIKASETKFLFLCNTDLFISPYKKIDIAILNPFICRFFTPSDNIIQLINNIEKKYNIDYDNTCCVFFRGLDKGRETITPSYEDMLTKTKEVTQESKDIRFLLQSDETEFFDYCKKSLENYFIFNDEIRHINKCDGLVENKCNINDNFKYSCFFLAIVFIMSKCKYLICNSSNVSLWIYLFRGHDKNVHQYLKQKEYIYNTRNKLYNKNDALYWY